MAVILSLTSNRTVKVNAEFARPNLESPRSIHVIFLTTLEHQIRFADSAAELRSISTVGYCNGERDSES